MSAGRNPEKDVNAKRTPFSKHKTVKSFRSMSGDFLYRYHEVHRTKLYVPVDTALSIPLKYEDVMRHMRRSIDNASEHTLKNYWNDEKERERERSCSQMSGSEQFISKS